MYWLDNNTGIPTAPTIPPVISAVKRYFTNGGAGVQPSVPEDFWFNMITDELLGVLDMAGIAPDKDDLGQLAKAIQSIAFSAYPFGSALIGVPIDWPLAQMPQDIWPGSGMAFLSAAGQAFNKETYPKLAQAYPSGVIPDLRGDFIRAWDNGRGVDAGRQLLSAQEDAQQRIVGSLQALSDINSDYCVIPRADGAFAVALRSGQSLTPIDDIIGATKSAGEVTFDSQRVVRTASENRPLNIAFHKIIRAA